MSEGISPHDQIKMLEAQLEKARKEANAAILAARPKPVYSYKVEPLKDSSFDILEHDLGGIRIIRTCENYEEIQHYSQVNGVPTLLSWNDSKVDGSVTYTWLDGHVYISGGGTHLLDFRSPEEKAKNAWTMGKYPLDYAEWCNIKDGKLDKYLWQRKGQ